MFCKNSAPRAVTPVAFEQNFVFSEIPEMALHLDWRFYPSIKITHFVGFI